MSRTLKRPMFKMGGNTNSGIVSGFEREKFSNGTRGLSTNVTGQDFMNTGSAPNFNIPAAAPTMPEDQLMSDISGLFASGMPEGMNRGFGLSEYLALVKLGANIAGAPNQGKGFKGFIRSAAPAVGEFAEDISALDAQKTAARNAYAASVRDAQLKGLATGAEIRSARDLQTQAGQQAINLEQEKGRQDRLTQAEAKNVIDKQMDYYNEAKTDYDSVRAQIQSLNPGTEGYEAKLADLRNQERMAIMRMYGALDLDLPDTAELGDFTYSELRSSAQAQALSAIGESVVPQPGEAKYDEYIKEFYKILGEIVAKERDILTADTGLTTQVREKEADGGRIGFQDGTTPGQISPTQAAPGMTGTTESQASPLTFAELRARLPKEVSNDTVRLLAASEAALIDFAQIQTQDDISRFNQKYNTDLQLPAQQAV
jgi:hypothetical protein